MPLPSAPFNTAKSIFGGLSVIKLKVAANLTGVTAATTVITLTAHGLTVGQGLDFVSGSGFTGLAAGTTYYVVSVPDANTFSISATYGGSAISVGTSTAGVFTPVSIFDSRLLTSKLTQTIKNLQRPDSKGVLRNVRKVLSEQVESFEFEMDEGKRLLEIFGGSLAGFVGSALCTLWIPDPQDATGLVSLKSEVDFSCSISRSGDTKFGDGDFTKPTITIESNKAGALVFTADTSA